MNWEDPAVRTVQSNDWGDYGSRRSLVFAVISAIGLAFAYFKLLLPNATIILDDPAAPLSAYFHAAIGTLVFLATGYLFVMSGYYYVSKPPQVKVGVKGRNLLGLSPNQVSVTANNPKSPVKAYLNKLHSPQPTVATTKLSPTQQAVQFEKPLTLPMFQNKPKQSTAQHSAFSKKKKNVDGTKSPYIPIYKTELSLQEQYTPGKSLYSSYTNPSNYGTTANVYDSVLKNDGSLPTYKVLTVPLHKEEKVQLDLSPEKALYKKLKVTQYVDGWTKNMRCWLSAMLKELVKWTSAVKLHYGPSYLFDYKSRLNQIQSEPSSKFTATASVVKPVDQTVLEITLRAARYFEHFGDSKEYVLNRIEELANGYCLNCYAYNGGGRWKDADWTSALPTDERIVMSIFCSWMDDQLKENEKDTSNPFTSNYLAEGMSSESKICIIQTQKTPLHYNILVAGEEWTITRGYDNIFHCLILFIYEIVTKHDSYLRKRLHPSLVDIVSTGL